MLRYSFSISEKIVTSQSPLLMYSQPVKKNTVETNLKEPLATNHSLALKPLLIAALAVSMATPTENIFCKS